MTEFLSIEVFLFFFLYDLAMIFQSPCNQATYLSLLVKKEIYSML